MKIDISKDRYWDEGITLIDGCTPCSPGCDHCWALSMQKRFKPEFKNQIKIHPERLKRFNTRKPLVFSIWNDLFHEDVPDEFVLNVFQNMGGNFHNTYLILTKRPQRMFDVINSINPHLASEGRAKISSVWSNVYFGLTVCNQAEADKKIPIFLQVPGKKFLSIEPMLGPIDLSTKCLYPNFSCRYRQNKRGGVWCETPNGICEPAENQSRPAIDAVILGGETGPGARPMNPDWVRSVRDQCESSNTPFFFKSWGKHLPNLKDCFGKEVVSPYSSLALDVKRLLDGRTHDDLPWVKP